MNISITDKATCQLAQELAQLTDETVTDAVTVAIKERMEREKHVQELLAIGKHCARLKSDGNDWPSAAEHGDFLYDERGLPK